MSESYNRAFAKIMRAAAQEAHANGHRTITPEHLLIAMTDDRTIRGTLERMHIEIGQIKSFIYTYFDRISQGDMGHPSLPPTEKSTELKTILDYADEIAGNPAGIDCISALMALMSYEKQCTAADILRNLGATLDKIVINRTDTLQNVQSLHSDDDDDYDEVWNDDPTIHHPSINPLNSTRKLSGKLIDLSSPLHQFCTDLNADTRHAKSGRVTGRDKELRMCIRALLRKKKPNAVLIGDEGVGKTAIAEGLAYAIEHDDAMIPGELKNACIYALDLTALMAGTKWRGDVEKRVKALTDDLQAHPDAILFIDEIHNLVGMGGGSSDAGDLANLLKPLLTSGDIRVIAATTTKEYRNKFSKDPAFKRRFQPVTVNEPDIAQTLHIIARSAGAYQKHHHVKFTPAALREAVLLGARYVHSSKMPDRIFDILDLTAAEKRMRHTNPGKRPVLTITPDDIRAMISEISRVPVTNLDSDGLQALKNLELNLNKKIIDQPDATRILSAALRRNRLGFGPDNRPQGCFLLEGPTGTGKTETAKQLALQFGMHLHRFDMSEYMEPHSASRLLGAPPGYIGFDQAGLLTQAMDKNPYSVILLDEIEKSHPQIFNLLLQIMDNGAITDAQGNTLDFRNTIIIMTTNAGSADAGKAQIGFVADDHHADHIVGDAIKHLFTPEFRNRLDAIIPFHALGHNTLLGVAQKSMVELKDRLKSSHDIDLKWSPAVLDFVCDRGHDPEQNARRINRVITEIFENAIADAIIAKKLKKSGSISISFNKTAANDDGRIPDISFTAPPHRGCTPSAG